MIQLDHITKTFDTGAEKVHAVSDVTLHIRSGEIFGIIGFSGAGKSTLLKIIVGELTPDTGEVITAKGKSLGYLAQHQDLEGDRTIEEELLSVKSDVIAMEQKIRAMEEQMHRRTIWI